MFRRIINSILFLAFIGLSAYAGYKFFFENKGPNHDPIKAVPPNAVAFLTGNNLIDFYRETDNTSLLWQDIKSSGLINKFDNQLDVWNTLDKKGALKNIKEAPFILSFHPAGDGKIDYLLSVSLPGKTSEKVDEILKQGNILISDFKDVYIEWSTTNHNGHIKALHYYQDSNWHCWDGTGADVTCN